MLKQEMFLKFLDASIRQRFDWAIAGGSCRNFSVGLPAKDYDVICILPPEDRNHQGAFEFAKQVSRMVSIHGGRSSVIQAYGQGDFGERHLAVIKIEYASDNYDLLVESSSSIMEAIGHFDCNMNQCYWNGLTKQVVFVGEPLDKLVWCKPVSAERKERMESFFKAYF